MIKDYLDYYSHFPDKRVKERSVDDALYRVREWRRIYESGMQQECKKKSRITLQQAADRVKIPKKTLEDYIQIFNKVSLISHIEDFSNKKMGFLRSFIRKNKAKIRKAAIKRQQDMKDCMDIKNEDIFSDEIKLEFDNKIISNNQKENLTSFDVKSEIKEEESDAYSQHIFSSKNQF